MSDTSYTFLASRSTVLVVVLLLVSAACGDDSTGPTTSFPAVTSSTPATATTTTPTTTTQPVPATPPTTTTVIETVPRPTELSLRPDGLGVVSFGDPPDLVLATIEALVGFPPTADTGWAEPFDVGFAVCPGTVVRLVDFEGLLVMFTDGGLYAPEGTEQFFSYAYGRAPPAITSGPPDGINLGVTVEDLLAIYPDAELAPDDPRLGPSFSVATPDPYPLLFGSLTGVAPADQIKSIRGGTGCGG